jgi:hypothetical protein
MVRRRRLGRKGYTVELREPGVEVVDWLLRERVASVLRALGPAVVDHLEVRRKFPEDRVA